LHAQPLLTTARNFLRAETLHASNDGVANATAALSMFDQYDIEEQLLAGLPFAPARGRPY
jgi:hypothetical protein